VRAEPLLSRHRQKPWVSVAKIFEAKDLISHADGELSGLVGLVLTRTNGFKWKMLNVLANRSVFFGGKGTKKRGGATWVGQGPLIGEM
jgi:hypothetical protein